MSTRSRAALQVLGSLLLLGAVGSAQAQTVHPELFLEILPAQATRPARAPGSGAMLVLNSLSDERRQRLAGSLQDLAGVVAKKRNPLFVSVDEDADRVVTENLVAELLPLFTAASALSAGRWRSPEGDLQIEAVQRCAASARCIPIYDPHLAGHQDDALERRVRFLSWSLGYATVLDAPSATLATGIADLLRSAPASPRIALVLTHAELHRLRKSTGLSSLRRAATVLAKRLPASPLSDALAGLARAGRDEVPWLQLPRNAILIVPRLGALATHQELAAEVRARLAAASAEVRWLATPR
jgi:hypothetical protein